MAALVSCTVTLGAAKRIPSAANASIRRRRSLVESGDYRVTSRLEPPRGFAIDPRGKFLLSVGMDSAGMTVYSIDQASGELKPIGHYPMGTQPNWIEIVDLK